MTLSEEVAQEVERLYRNALEQEAGSSVTFGPISVEQDGSIFRLTVVHDAAGSFDRDEAGAAIRNATESLWQLGRRPLVVCAFVIERDYPDFLKERQRTSPQDS